MEIKLRRAWLGMREECCERGSLVIGQVRWPASSQRWMEERSKVCPEERMTGSDIIWREMGHFKWSGTSTSDAIGGGALSFTFFPKSMGQSILCYALLNHLSYCYKLFFFLPQIKHTFLYFYFSKNIRILLVSHSINLYQYKN